MGVDTTKYNINIGNMKKGVRNAITDVKGVKVGHVTLKDGARIQETAVALQQNIKMAVQSMTGKPVTRVNVHVEGMTMTEEKND